MVLFGIGFIALIVSAIFVLKKELKEIEEIEREYFQPKKVKSWIDRN